MTERTREIGVRKAIGARRGDILMQFLIEASTIAAIGGALGVIFGVLLAKIVSWVSPLPSAVQLWSVLGGLVGGAERGPILRHLSGIESREARSRWKLCDRNKEQRPMATLGKTLPRTVALPVRSRARKESAR